MADVDLTSKDLAALASPTKLMDREWAPCRFNCPVHADVRAYIQAIAEGDFVRGIDIIREALPLAVVCGRICHHPCEANCRRNDVDEAVAIREVKRFVAEKQGARGATIHKAPRQDKARVAIVGGGPAGLSAALVLAQRGYQPTIFEKFPVAGGICATAIPKYRLPREKLQIDIDWIAAHGVKIVTGVNVGRDKSIDDLRGEGFAAVLVAAGLAESRMLDIPGGKHADVWPVLKFLTAMAFEPDEVKVGQKVLVIGGGNVACDAARSAVRLGAEVTMMCLEAADEMPAWDWEVREAEEEGVRIVHRRGPVKVLTDKAGKISGVTARKVTSVFDQANGKKVFSPKYYDSDVIEMPCQTVIMAIGQMANMRFVEGGGLGVDARGRLVYNPATQQTSRPDVFAAGEIVTPPGSVVEACASGKRAADAIDQYLSGKTIALNDTLPTPIDVIDDETAEAVIKVQRCPVQAAAPEKRRASFDEVDANFTIEQALIEARRCMSCGSGAEVIIDKCAACLTCLRVCPFDIPKVTDVARIASTKCQACGMCIAECPANAIVPRGRETTELRERVAAVLAASPAAKRLALVCGHHASAEQWQGRSAMPADVAAVYLASMARISVPELLSAFEAGAASVAVVACRPGMDRYPTATERIRKRVAQAQALLAEAGLPDRLSLLEIAEDGPAAIAAAISAAPAAKESSE